MKSVLKFIFILLPLVLSCKKTTDIYLGVPLQPKFDENSFIPGLNIFGILRPDFSANSSNSFVIVHKVTKAVGDTSFWLVENAQVAISPEQGSSLYAFIQSSDKEYVKDRPFSPPANFVPTAGETYNIRCSTPDLPELSGTTYIPKNPNLIYQTWHKQKNTLFLRFQKDSGIYMLDLIAYNNGEIFGKQRNAIVGNNSENTEIEMPALPTKPDSIVVFSYDKNLATYYLTSNTSINFNKYRVPFSTVENGYGVFGSLNKAVFNLKK